MAERVGMVVRSVGKLEEKLAEYVAGKQDGGGVYCGQGKKSNEDGMRLFSSDADLQETVRKWMESGKYEKLLELWVRGVEVEWERMYGGGGGRGGGGWRPLVWWGGGWCVGR